MGYATTLGGSGAGGSPRRRHGGGCRSSCGLGRPHGLRQRECVGWRLLVGVLLEGGDQGGARRMPPSPGFRGAGRAARASAPSDTGQSRRDSALSKLPKSVTDRVRNHGNSAPTTSPAIDAVDSTRLLRTARRLRLFRWPLLLQAPAVARTAAVGDVAPGGRCSCCDAEGGSQRGEARAADSDRAEVVTRLGPMGSVQLDTLLAALDAIRRAFGRFNQSVPAATVTSSATVSPNLLFNRRC